jgi:hypothetical protein
MQDLTYSTPGLLFPAISLLMLAYTNRFLTLAGLVRHLAMEYRNDHSSSLKRQIDNLRLRITLLRHCQSLGVLSLLFVTGSLTALFFESQWLARASFAIALLSMLGSLAISLSEIRLSGTALNIELDRVEASPEAKQVD